MADPVASIGKVIVKHLPTNEDLIGGIKRLCADNGIRYGQVLSVIGSVRSLAIECVVISEDDENAFDFGPPRVIAGPLQILSLVGLVFEDQDGDTVVHVHGTFSNSNGAIYGGHLLEGQNPVAVRLSIVIGEIVGVEMTEIMDNDSGHLIMRVR
jgi:hypothetical protein